MYVRTARLPFSQRGTNKNTTQENISCGLFETQRNSILTGGGKRVKLVDAIEDFAHDVRKADLREGNKPAFTSNHPTIPPKRNLQSRNKYTKIILFIVQRLKR